MKMLNTAVANFVASNPSVPKGIEQSIRNKKDLEDAVDSISAYLNIPPAKRQQILDAINRNKAASMGITEEQLAGRGLALGMEDLRNQVYNLDPSRMENFANALGLTVEDCKELKDVLGDASLADLLAAPEDTVSKIQDYTDMLTDILDDGKLSMDNYMAILDTYPSLLNKYDETGKLVSSSMENVQENLFNSLYGSEGSLGTILGFNIYEDVKSNESAYENFKSLMQDSGKFTDEQLAFLDKYSTFNDDMLGELANNKDMWGMYADYMDGFAAR